MTKSTGARARQHRLENLLWADVMLRRVAMHLLESIGWARRDAYDAELCGLRAAYSYVRTAYLDIVAEQKMLQKEIGAVVIERRRTVYEEAADLR